MKIKQVLYPITFVLIVALSVLAVITTTAKAAVGEVSNYQILHDDYGTEVMRVTRDDVQSIWDEFLYPDGMLEVLQDVMYYDVYGLAHYRTGDRQLYTMDHLGRWTDSLDAERVDTVYYLSENDDSLNMSVAFQCNRSVCNFYKPGTAMF